MAWQKVRIPVPDDWTPAKRREFADLAIELIVQRTQEGKGVYKQGRGKTLRDFPGYSESYVNSLDFAIAGKSKGDVDLQLSGDMLASIELLSDQKGSVLIGFQNGTEENDRAEGNKLGTYGQKTANPKKARPFLDFTKSELSTLINMVNE